MSVANYDVNCLSTRYCGMTEVWKFGYGSNMGQEFLRVKKQLNPFKFERSILRGFSLIFPKSHGFDFVEPSFATTKEDAEGYIHGVSTLFSIEDAVKLNSQEGVGKAYNLAVCKVMLYDGSELEVEVYVPTKPIPIDFPEGVCSKRYRDILVTGAQEANLEASWIEKLQGLQVYTPSGETIAAREKLPPPSALPQMTIAELALHNGSKSDEYPHYISSCGYIFQVKDIFQVFHGRDVTYRNILQSRGINLDSNDDGGKSPFPRLSKLEPSALEYALQYRDRFIHKSGGQPLAVLREFWEEQEAELEGVFRDNSLSKL